MKQELKTLMQTVRVYSLNRGMGFSIQKCTMQIMRSGKRQMTERTELPKQEKKNQKARRK